MMRKKENGEIVEVEGGGRIIRSLRRKDRHSKVCTSKGPKDRRVRLSANTAIQFYDVQDRLGYDRPSKAIDWLMKEAKPAIDALQDDHRNHDLLTTVLDTSEAFRTEGAQTSGFHDYSLGIMDGRNKSHEIPIEEIGPKDFSWNIPSYDSGNGFGFVDREPLQSSYPPMIHTFNNEFVDEEAFLGLYFQQDNQLEEEENCNLVSKTRRSSGTSYQIL